MVPSTPQKPLSFSCTTKLLPGVPEELLELEELEDDELEDDVPEQLPDVDSTYTPTFFDIECPALSDTAILKETRPHAPGVKVKVLPLMPILPLLKLL